MRLLELLVERAGALVTREEMRELLWPDQVVEFDQGLNFAVRKIRAALGDDADAPRFLATVPGRGYRFIAAVEPVGEASAEAETASPGSRLRRVLAAAVAVVALGLAGVLAVRALTPPETVTVIFEPAASTSAPQMAATFGAALRQDLGRQRAVDVVDVWPDRAVPPGAHAEGLPPLRMRSYLELEGERLSLRLVMGLEGESEVFWESLHNGTPDQLPALRGAILDELEEIFDDYRHAAAADPATRREETNSVTQRSGR